MQMTGFECVLFVCFNMAYDHPLILIQCRVDCNMSSTGGMVNSINKGKALNLLFVFMVYFSLTLFFLA